MSLAYPDVDDPNITSLQFPILVGGLHMELIQMSAVYSNMTFALIDSAVGLIPMVSGPQMSMNNSFPASHKGSILHTMLGSILKRSCFLETVMTVHSNAQSLEDLELTEEIKISFGRDCFELAEAVAKEVVKSVKAWFNIFKNPSSKLTVI